MPLKEGTPAPDFSLPDQNGNMHSLAQYRGRKVVLYFYPRDNTPGCTKQACGFAERHSRFSELDAVILGVSRDSAASHLRFQEKFSLPFTLLSDPELAAHRAYDVIQPKKTPQGIREGTLRSAFLIDENGILVKALPGVKAADNPEEMLELVKGLADKQVRKPL